MNNRKCFECNGGTYHKIRENFRLTTQDGDNVEIPSVMRWRCDQCADEVLPPESGRQIEDWIAEREESHKKHGR